MERYCHHRPKPIIEPTLIILKHSLRENAIPTPDQLEIGEAALSLFPGQESLWIKNGKGEVVDIRKPSSSALWDSVFVSYPTREEFDKELEEGKINEEKIYFIAQEKQIWVKGEFYASDYDPSELDKLISQKIVMIPSQVYKLDPESASSEDIETAFGGKDKFRNIVTSVNKGDIFAAMGIGSGAIPVSAESKINGADRLDLMIEWLYGGYYSSIHITFRYDIFGVESFDNISIEDMRNKIEELDTRLSTAENDLCWIEAE